MNNTLLIDSLDINWLVNDKTFNYRFSFNKNDTLLGILHENFRNVKSVSIKNIIIPNFFVNIRDVHSSKKLGLLPQENGEIISSNIIFPKLTDLKYITVKIDEIKSNITGTNETFNKSIVFVFKDN